MQVLTQDAMLANGGPPAGDVVFEDPALVRVEVQRDAAGAPTGAVLLSAWARDGALCWVLVGPPEGL
jgi:hypothetical protein